MFGAFFYAPALPSPVGYGILKSPMKYKTIALTLLFSWFCTHYSLEFEPKVSFAQIHDEMDQQEHLITVLKLRQITFLKSH